MKQGYIILIIMGVIILFAIGLYYYNKQRIESKRQQTIQDITTGLQEIEQPKTGIAGWMEGLVGWL